MGGGSWRTDNLTLYPDAVVDYLETIPAEIPRDRVLVHNNVKPTRHLGARGFRAWFQVSVAGLELCPCDWSGLEHYRVTPSEP